jgi:hypothetical protein
LAIVKLAIYLKSLLYYAIISNLIIERSPFQNSWNRNAIAIAITQPSLSPTQTGTVLVRRLPVQAYSKPCVPDEGDKYAPSDFGGQLTSPIPRHSQYILHSN